MYLSYYPCNLYVFTHLFFRFERATTCSSDTFCTIHIYLETWIPFHLYGRKPYYLPTLLEADQYMASEPQYLTALMCPVALPVSCNLLCHAKTFLNISTEYDFVTTKSV